MYEALWTTIQRGYLQVDETPVKVQNPDKKGYHWCYFSPTTGVVIFKMSLTRSQMVVNHRLAQFKGLLQTDAYSGYNAMRKKETVTGLGCLIHARRKFSDVFKISKETRGIAAQCIEKVVPLYELEERMRMAHCSFHTRTRLRQKLAFPILKGFDNG